MEFLQQFMNNHYQWTGAYPISDQVTTVLANRAKDIVSYACTQYGSIKYAGTAGLRLDVRNQP